MISDRPETPAGTMAFSEGRPNKGTAHDPGAMAYPSDSETLLGRPRRRTKVLPGTLPGGPTWIDNGACEAGSAVIVVATTMRGASARCASANPVIEFAKKSMPAAQANLVMDQDGMPPAFFRVPATAKSPFAVAFLSLGITRASPKVRSFRKCTGRRQCHLPCFRLHSRNCWNRRSCSAASDPLRAACWGRPCGG